MALARGRGLLRWAFHSAWKLPPSWGPFLSFSEPFTAGMWALEHNLHQGGDPCFCFVLMWSIFKVFLNLLQYCFCFMFWFSGHEACGILAPQPGIKSTSPALEGKVLTTRPLGNRRARGSTQVPRLSACPQMGYSLLQAYASHQGD